MAKVDVPVEDRGCEWAPKCVTCPWRECVKELRARERHELIDALRIVRRYLPEPDRALKV